MNYSSSRHKTNTAKILEICCEHHLTSTGSCNPKVYDCFGHFPIEIVNLILAQFAALGSQFAYIAALVHPRYSKSLQPRQDGKIITFAHVKTSKGLKQIPNFPFVSIPILVLRLGSSSAISKLESFDSFTLDQYRFSSQSVKKLQIGPSHYPYTILGMHPEELSILRGSQHAEHVVLFPKIKILSLLDVGWASLEAVHSLKQVEDI